MNPEQLSKTAMTSSALLESVPNMRLLCNRYCKGSFQLAAGLYRSSKPDQIKSEHLEEFRKLGIQCIFDFRSVDEYFNRDCDRLLDEEYVLQKVVLPKNVGDNPTFKHVDHNRNTEGLIGNVEREEKKHHYLINFFGARYILRSFARLPCYMYCVGIFHLLCDLIRRDKSFKRFSTFFTSTIVNRRGIKGQYIDIVEYCQPSICAALKLIANPENHPALLNCAHGKDRTGIISALILTCLGMSKEYIVEEYALSEEGLRPIRHQIEQDLLEKYKMSEEFITADGNTMRNLLFYIEDKYGSVENYMEVIGFSREEQRSLRLNLVALCPSSEGAGDGDKQ